MSLETSYADNLTDGVAESLKVCRRKEKKMNKKSHLQGTPQPTLEQHNVMSVKKALNATQYCCSSIVARNNNPFLGTLIALSKQRRPSLHISTFESLVLCSCMLYSGVGSLNQQ